jgi:glycosyltransferase involved in cell wall biosynthesis
VGPVPDVTVVVAFKDNARTILDCVRSVVAQSIGDWRLVLLDDGSVDGGADLVAAVRDPRITLVRGRENLGPPVRLNELTELVDTPFLARMDGDDLMHPRRLERSLDALATDPGLSFVCGHAVSIDAAGVPSGLRRSASNPSTRDHFVHAPFVHATVTGRTEWFRLHPYDPAFRRCQDQELWVRTLGDRRVRTLEAPLLYLREAGTVPARKYAASMAGTRRVVSTHRERLGRRSALALSGLTRVKEAAYRVAEPLGAVDALVARRARPLAPDELRRHAEVVAGIRGVALPGVD